MNSSNDGSNETAELLAEARNHPSALGRLLTRYHRFLQVHLGIKFRMSDEEADELLQEFYLEKFVEKAIHLNERFATGRFRSYVLSALDRFVIDQYRRGKTRKCEAVQAMPLEIDPVGAANDPADADDVAWAMFLIEEAIASFRSHCEREGLPHHWEIFVGRDLAMAQGCQPIPYTALAFRCGRGGEANPEKWARNAHGSACERFQRQLREIIKGESNGDIDEILANMFEVLAAARENWLRAISLRIWGEKPQVSRLSTTLNSDLPITPTRMAKLLDVSATIEGVAELREDEIWTNLFSSVTLLDALGSESNWSARLNRADPMGVWSLAPLARILDAPPPSVEILKLLKDFAKTQERNASGEEAKWRFTALYYLSCAISRLRWNASITSIEDARFLAGLKSCLDRAWLDASSKEVLRSALLAIQNTGMQSYVDPD